MNNYVFLLSFWSKIGDAIASFFFSILLWLNAIIYSFVSYVYQIFLVLAQGGNIIDNRIISRLVSRIYIIIGVIVLFLVAYSLLKSMVNPDEAIKGKKSPINIIKDVVISIVLIAFIPTIFDFAFKVQEAFLTQNTIGKIIAGSSGGDNENTIRMGGYTMAKTVWQAFLVVNDGYCTPEEELPAEDGTITGANGCTVLMNDDGVSYGTMWKEADKSTTFWGIRNAVSFIIDDQIDYIFIIDILCGAFVLYVLVFYCFDMALRLVKLAVFELIAPLPILSRIIPNENASKMFNNWIKATISTFVEVFIRIAILYFAVIIISTIGTSIDNIFASASYTTSEALPLVKSIAKVLVVVGIVMFIKQAPAIIKEITGLDGGKYGKSLMKGAGALFGSIGGGATAAMRSFAGDKDKPLGRRFARALSAGAKGNVRGAWNGRKTEKLSDIPKNAGKASADTLAARARIQAAGGQLNYLQQYGQSKIDLVKDWAGGSSYELNQIKEFAGNIDTNESTIEGTWKKTQAYIDSKANEEKLKNLVGKYANEFNAQLAELCRFNGIDPNSSDPDDQAYVDIARQQVNDDMKNRYGIDYLDTQHRYDEAKYTTEAITRSERKKKAEVIASAARNLQLEVSKHPNLKPDINKVLEREPDSIKRNELKRAYEKYSNLDDEKQYQQFISDLQSNDDRAYNMAASYADFLDKFNNQVKFERDQAIYKESKRPQFGNDDSKKGSGK